MALEIKTTEKLYVPEMFGTVERIIQFFEESVHENTFHYASRDTKIIGYGAQVPNEYLLKAIEKLKERGFNVEYKYSYCGHGPFQSIELND